MMLEREKFEKMFYRMLKTDTQEGIDRIPDRFLEYTFQVTTENIEFTALFENVCRMAFVEFYRTLFPED